MMDAAAEAMAFAKGHVREDLSRNRMLLHSLVRDIEIIGEAGSQISEEFRSEHPEIPWAMIRGMRNRLIHAYWDVNVALVWSTVMEDMRDLQRILEALLTEAQDDGGGRP
jgi:uncharacterized protein with HEPN domain